MDRLDGFELSWLIETSPGNYQGGIILAEPLTDGPAAVRLLNAVIDSGLCDAGATGPLSRWARLPVAINGKPKYADDAGTPFQCRLIEWRPDNRYTPQEIVDRLQLELAPAGRPNKTAKSPAPSDSASYGIGDDGDDVLIPKTAENPVVAALKARRLYKTPLGSGKHDITCPWVQEHTDALDTGAAYFEPDEFYVPWVAFAASTPTATSTASGLCSNSSVCAMPKHATSRSSGWWPVTCTAWSTRQKRSWQPGGAIIRRAV
jgi:hypothetical protein